MPAVAKPAPVALPRELFEPVNKQFGECLLSKTFLDDFYAEFTGRSAEVRAMFANTDMTAQKDALRGGLTFLMLYANANAFAADKLDRLGKTHARTGYNILPDMYPLWVDSLVKTVRKHSPGFTSEDESRWRKVLLHGIERIKSHY